MDKKILKTIVILFDSAWTVISFSLKKSHIMVRKLGGKSQFVIYCSLYLTVIQN